MTRTPALLLLLLGLPALAVAASDNADEAARCAQLSAGFGSSPRSLSIGELDALKTCINTQEAAMREEQRQLQTQTASQGLESALPGHF